MDQGEARRLLEQQIRDAFAGVTLGSGISLRQSAAIENYLKGMTKDQYARLPKSDVTTDWSAIPETEFSHVVVPHLDAEGLRYYLPALMLWLLDNYDNGDFGSEGLPIIGTVWALAPHLDLHPELSLARLEIFTEAQRGAIASFVEALPIVVDLHRDDAKTIDHWFNAYWRGFLPDPV
jgi:hypothetical protein